MNDEHIEIDYCQLCGKSIITGKPTVEVGICQDCYNKGDK